MAPVSDYSLFRTLATVLLPQVVHADDDNDCDAYCIGRWKIIFSAILFVEGLVFAHLVLFIRNRTRKSQDLFNTFTSFGHALAAGLFLSTGLMHIFPEAIALFDGESHADDDHADHVVRQDHDHDHDEGENHDGDDDHQGEDSDGEHGGHEIKFPWASFVLLYGFYGLFFFEKIIIPRLFGVSSSHGESATDSEQSVSLQGKEEEGNILSEKATAAAAPLREDSFFSKTFAIALLQVLGISAHSLFEAMAMGLGKNFTTVLNIFIAVVTHRWATSIAIAFTAAAKLSYFPFLVVFLFFSSMVPIGVGIGAALSGLSTMIQGILFSLSAATFLYIGAYEGMVDTFEHGKKMLIWKFITTIAGASMIVIITGILVAEGIH